MQTGCEDTIAAISTAVAPAGIGIVRISGPHALAVADGVFRSPGKKRLTAQKGYTVHYGHVAAPGEKKVIDEVLAVVLRAPHSYTGEDTVELDCHGGVLAVRRVLDAVCAAGARLAEPGEFTKRAFLNGRLDLSQAEAVMDVIAAKNDRALSSAQDQMAGLLSERIGDMRRAILHLTAHIEAALDDPEHMSLDGIKDELREAAAAQLEGIRALLRTADEGRLLQDGIKTVIAGKPNAGKSSILNFLSGEERAIVTDIAGTTRDVLEEQVNMRGITLRLLDTAGIHEAADTIERIGVERALSHVKEADLVLFVVDQSLPLDENDFDILRTIKESRRKTIFLLNKADLSPLVTPADLRQLADFPVVEMSAKQHQGWQALAAQIEQLFFGGHIGFHGDVTITNARHKEALRDAAASLTYALQSMDDGLPEDFWSIDLMGAAAALGKITGEDVGEELVNDIFANFCMGK